MIEFIVLVLALSLFLYVLLAGADFGAGILQLLPLGLSREEKTNLIGKAIGPVWEANHIWLILALVILFNGFPALFWFVSEWFHFPLGALVMGIIFRGASFTFQHYDPIQDGAQRYYHWIFGLSSLWCPFWIGIIVGSLMAGDFALTDTDPFIKYFHHWLNPFSFSMGLFLTLLMVFNAALFLYIETPTHQEKWRKIAFRSFLALIASGALTHLVFYWQNPARWKLFFNNPLSLVLIAISFILLYPQTILIQKRYRTITRLLAGLQLMLIMAAGFAPLYPTIVLFRDETFLSVYGSAAEKNVLQGLTIALAIGCILILPAYAYLMKIFKKLDR